MIPVRAPFVSIAFLATALALPACSGGGGGGSGASPSAQTTAGWSEETVDFETLMPGMVVDQVFGSLGTGPIAVSGSSTALGTQNAAIIFDSANGMAGGQGALATVGLAPPP